MKKNSAKTSPKTANDNFLKIFKRTIFPKITKNSKKANGQKKSQEHFQKNFGMVVRKTATQNLLKIANTPF